jgi:hypothetical protein
VDFAKFERAAEQSAAKLERETLRRLLQSLDIDAERVWIGGKEHAGVGRYKATYSTQAGPVEVERSIYRDAGEKWQDGRAGELACGGAGRRLAAERGTSNGAPDAEGTSREAEATALQLGRLPYSRSSFERVGRRRGHAAAKATRATRGAAHPRCAGAGVSAREAPQQRGSSGKRVGDLRYRISLRPVLVAGGMHVDMVRLRAMLSLWLRVSRNDTSATHIGSLASRRARLSSASLATAWPASSCCLGAQKNCLWSLRSSAPKLVRPAAAARPRPLLRRPAHLPRSGGATRSVPELRHGETGKARPACRQSVLHQALRVLRWTALSVVDHQGARRGAAP